MRSSSRLAALTVLLFLLTANLYAASTVRGRLYRQANGRAYPAAGVAVRLLHPQGAARSATSTSDGFFYFYNVPAGSYMLEVRVGGHAQSFSIRVDDRDYTDIAPIQVP